MKPCEDVKSFKETTLNEKRVVLDLRRGGTSKRDGGVREQREIWSGREIKCQRNQQRTLPGEGSQLC